MIITLAFHLNVQNISLTALSSHVILHQIKGSDISCHWHSFLSERKPDSLFKKEGNSKGLAYFRWARVTMLSLRFGNEPLRSFLARTELSFGGNDAVISMPLKRKPCVNMTFV